LRDTNELLKCADKIECPVVAIHGDYDSHPIEGVEKPLSGKLSNFKMIKIENVDIHHGENDTQKINFLKYYGKNYIQ